MFLIYLNHSSVTIYSHEYRGNEKKDSLKNYLQQNILKGKNMLKQILITSALLLGSTSQLSATPCSYYASDRTDDNYFYCLDNTSSSISASASYTRESYDPETGESIDGGAYASSDMENSIGYCSSSTDRTCDSSAPSNIYGMVFVKNTTETDDYFKANFISSYGFDSVEAHIPPDTDATLTASSIITEPVNLPSTADTSDEAVNLFDFTITDGGTSDGLSTDVSQIVLHTSGTADFSKVTWKLNGNDALDVVGTYDDGANTLTFSGLAISVANGSNETYTLSGYYSTPTGLTDNATYIFSVDGDTDLTLDATKTQMGTTTAVDNGTGTKVDITATKLRFRIQPSNESSSEPL